MSFWLISIPLISACIGWFLTRLAIYFLFHPRLPKKIPGLTIQGLLPKRQNEFAVSAARLLSREFISLKEIEQKVLNPVNLQRIMPEIEKHIDHFLRVKLKDAMPMVAMFVGDKTISQLKEVFMAEMETLFPVIMESYIKELQNNINVEEVIIRKLLSQPAIKIESFLLEIFNREFRYMQLTGALLGIIIGSIQVIITLFIQG